MTVRIITADVLAGLAQLPDESVHTCVTSPPYWGLRDYGTGQWEGGDAECEHTIGRRDHNGEKQASSAGTSRDSLAGMDECRACGARRIDDQIGLEPTLAEHIERLVTVFEQVRRVLRPDGVLFLNYGDAYASHPSGHKTGEDGRIRPGIHDPNTKLDDRTFTNKPFSTVGNGLKPKDLMLIPHRLAIALQDSGWWVRSDIIWAKPNPMPESVTDRPTNAHEHVFLLTKNGADPTFWTHERGKGGSRTRPEPDYIWRHTSGEESTEPRTGQGWTRRNLWRGSAYWWDAEAVREPNLPQSVERAKYSGRVHPKGWHTEAVPISGGEQEELAALNPAGRNLRNVWTIATHSFPDAHFATFAPKLVETCLKAGCPEKVCADCGAPYVREVERAKADPDPIACSEKAGATPRKDGDRWNENGGSGFMPIRSKTLGFSPSCDCQQTFPIPAGTVLDPFGGSGTTGLVADRMKRNAVLIELSPEYAEMARRRIEGDAGLFAQVDLQAEAAP